MHPRDGVVVVVNVRNGLHQKVAGKVGWPEDWWPTLKGRAPLGVTSSPTISAKHLLTDARNRLNPDIIKTNECLKHWFGKPAEEEVDQRAEASGEASGEAAEEAAATKVSKDNESDTEDDVVYEVDSNGEIVWKNYYGY